MSIKNADWSFSSDDARFAHAARKSLSQYLRSINAGDEAQTAGAIILGELLSNVIMHAPGQVMIWLDRDHRDRVLNVLDQGKRLWDYYARRPAAARSEHGRGLLLAQTYAKNMTFRLNKDPLGTHVAATLPS